MYGLIIEGMSEMIKARFGEDAWERIRDASRINEYTFVTHRMYSEKIIPRIGKACAEATGCKMNEVMEITGVTFVQFLSKYGYDRMLRVLGRNMRDFLNGLDNLHEYLRFSYPKMKPPSFFCTAESKNGLTLHYRSKRQGYDYYVKGQLKEVGRIFYNLDVEVEIEDTGKSGDNYYVVFRLKFNNKEFEERGRKSHAIGDNVMVRSSLLFQLFPFHIVFSSEMKIKNAGQSLLAVLPDLVGKNFNDAFELKRPFVNFTYDQIQAHENNVFEVASCKFIARDTSEGCPYKISHSTTVYDPTFDEEDEDTFIQESDQVEEAVSLQNGDDEGDSSGDDLMTVENKVRLQISRPSFVLAQGPMITTTGWSIHSPTVEILEEVFHPKQLRLKGQMMCVPEWKCYIFLATPLLPNLEAMFETGLYINDLSMHDSSRDLVLAGTQQSAELKLALDQELQKSAQLEESMKKLDQEMKKTDSLLYQMIPRQVADKLRRGEPATSTCEVFHEVTILFSDVVGFTTICSRINPMAVVSMLNIMYTKFDKLSEDYHVYKVETIGDAYMVVSGAPNPTKFHAVLVAEMSIAMLSSVEGIIVPSSDDMVRIRVGIHTGTVVAGVVGLKMPRYCLFGDTVNTASRMESTGEACHIHLSEVTKQYLEEYPGVYKIQNRGSIPVKGKGTMKTYWLLGKECPGGLQDPWELAKEYMRGRRSRSSSQDSPLLKRSIPGSRMDIVPVERRGSLLSSPSYTPVGLEEVERALTPRPNSSQPGSHSLSQSSNLLVPGKPGSHRDATSHESDSLASHAGDIKDILSLSDKDEEENLKNETMQCICPLHDTDNMNKVFVDVAVQAVESSMDGVGMSTTPVRVIDNGTVNASGNQRSKQQLENSRTDSGVKDQVDSGRNNMEAATNVTHSLACCIL